MSYEPQQPRPDYRSDGGYGSGRPDPRSAQYQGDPRTGSSGPQDDEKTVAILTHLSGPIAAIVSVGWLGFLGPLIVWFIYKDKPGYNFTKESARRAFNFNFSLWVISTASWLAIVLTFGILGLILWVVPLVVTILMVVFHSLAAMAAARCDLYEYPMTFIKIIK